MGALLSCKHSTVPPLTSVLSYAWLIHRSVLSGLTHKPPPPNIPLKEWVNEQMFRKLLNYCLRLLSLKKKRQSLAPSKQNIKKWVLAQDFCTVLYLHNNFVNLVRLGTGLKTLLFPQVGLKASTASHADMKRVLPNPMRWSVQRSWRYVLPSFVSSPTWILRPCWELPRSAAIGSLWPATQPCGPECC